MLDMLLVYSLHPEFNSVSGNVKQLLPTSGTNLSNV